MNVVIKIFAALIILTAGRIIVRKLINQPTATRLKSLRKGGKRPTSSALLVSLRIFFIILLVLPVFIFVASCPINQGRSVAAAMSHDAIAVVASAGASGGWFALLVGVFLLGTLAVGLGFDLLRPKLRRELGDSPVKASALISFYTIAFGSVGIIALLGTQSYTGFTKQGFVQNTFFQIHDQITPYSNIASVRVKCSDWSVGGDNAKAKSVLRITISVITNHDKHLSMLSSLDGEDLRIGRSGRRMTQLSPDESTAMISTLQARGVNLDRQPCAESYISSLNQAQLEYYRALF